MQAKLEGVNPATYRIYIAPLIFALAPVINTLLSLVWHPKPGDPWHFDFELPRLEAAGRHRARRGRHVPRADVEGRHGGAKGGPKPATPAATGDRPDAPSQPEAAMTPEEAVTRLNTVLAHAWMIRTFLKHADEIQADEEHARRAADALRQHPRRRAGVPARRPRRLPPPAEG